jgi:2-dehydrotetronate isomerase
MPRFSANLGFLWTQLPLLGRIEAAARAEFRAIELHWPYDTPAREVRAICARLGLELLCINTPVGNAAKGEFGLAAVPGREQDFQAAFDLSVAYALEAEAQSIHVMAGVVPPSQREAAAGTLVENLAIAANKARGLTLLLEPINPRDKPGYFYARLEEAVAIIEHVGAPNLRLMFDTYHVGVADGDIMMKLQKYLPMIGHVQIAAVPSRAEPDEGEINYAAIFSVLDRIGYSGWVGCEYKPRGDTNAGLTWMQDIGGPLGFKVAPC